jgi:uncharacterized membrane protein YqgA involved in biofilm formation
MLPITGTVINVAAVVVGGTLGTLLGNRLPEKTRQTVLSGLGLMTLVIGVTMAVQTANVLIPLFSILLGGVLGEALRIDDGLNWLGRKAESRFGGSPAGSRSGEAGGRFAQGFVTASLIFCIGPMAVLGSLQNGLMGDYSLLTVKSVLDGFAAMALAASLGAGVILSCTTVLAYQGAWSLLAMLFAAALGGVTRQTPWVIELTATGGVVILSIALILLDIKRIRTASLLPAIFIAPAIVWGLGALGIGLP